MPEIPGPGTPILVLIDDGSITNNAAIVRRLNNGTVAVNIPAMGGEWEAEAIIVYKLLRRTSQAETETQDQPSLGEEPHVESIEPASAKPSASAESEGKHQENSSLKRKRRRARKL